MKKLRLSWKYLILKLLGTLGANSLGNLLVGYVTQAGDKMKTRAGL